VKLLLAVLFAVAAPVGLTAQGRGHDNPVGDSAAVVALVESARGANAVLCELAARSVESEWGWDNEMDVRAPRDAAVRAAVNQTRGLRTPRALVPQLAASLRDDDACVRRLAAPLLARVRTVTANQALRSALQNDRATTREAAALGLGFTGDPSVIPALLAGLQDAESRVRVACAWALGEIEDARAVGALVRLLREDRDADVRRAAAWALGAIEG
jgi:HEAT repeat protein